MNDLSIDLSQLRDGLEKALQRAERRIQRLSSRDVSSAAINDAHAQLRDAVGNWTAFLATTVEFDRLPGSASHQGDGNGR